MSEWSEPWRGAVTAQRQRCLVEIQPTVGGTVGLGANLGAQRIQHWASYVKNMKQSIGYVSLLVRDYDEAIAFYTERLGFEVIADTPLAEGKRWVLVAPIGSSECRILLAKAKNQEEIDGIGRQSGGRVFLFLHTDDFWRDFRAFSLRGVQFCEQPREEVYGTVAVFVDISCNRWDLLQLTPAPNTDGDAGTKP